MSPADKKHVLPGLLWKFSFVSVLLLSGCNLPNLRGGNFRDDLAKWGETQRRPGAPNEFWGTSEQARQVERNLGIE